MPRFDGTGPKGEGRMTGRCRGNCSDEKTLAEREGEDKTTLLGKPGRLGLGRGLGRGRNFGRRGQECNHSRRHQRMGRFN